MFIIKAIFNNNLYVAHCNLMVLSKKDARKFESMECAESYLNQIANYDKAFNVNDWKIIKE